LMMIHKYDCSNDIHKQCVEQYQTQPARYSKIV